MSGKERENCRYRGRVGILNASIFGCLRPARCLLYLENIDSKYIGI